MGGCGFCGDNGLGFAIVGDERKRVMKARFMVAATLAGMMFTCASWAQNSIVGIGVMLRAQGQGIVIAGVLPNSPASRMGLTRGLIVQKIDGEPAKGGQLKQCVDRLRGEEGTRVKLELVDKTQGKTNEVELIREEIKLPAAAAGPVIK